MEGNRPTAALTLPQDNWAPSQLSGLPVVTRRQGSSSRLIDNHQNNQTSPRRKGVLERHINRKYTANKCEREMRFPHRELLLYDGLLEPDFLTEFIRSFRLPGSSNNGT